MCGENGLLSRSVVIGPTAVFASSPATRFASFLFYRPPPNLVLILYFQPPQGSVEDNTTRHNKAQTVGRFQKPKRIIVVGETSTVSVFDPHSLFCRGFHPLDRCQRGSSHCGRGFLEALFVFAGPLGVFDRRLL